MLHRTNSSAKIHVLDFLKEKSDIDCLNYLLSEEIEEDKFGWFFSAFISSPQDSAAVNNFSYGQMKLFIFKEYDEIIILDHFDQKFLHFLISQWILSRQSLSFEDYLKRWKINRFKKKKKLAKVRKTVFHASCKDSEIVFRHFLIAYAKISISDIKSIATASIEVKPYLSECYLIILDQEDKKYFLPLAASGFNRLFPKLQKLLGGKVLLVADYDNLDIESGESQVFHAWPPEKLNEHLSSEIEVSFRSSNSRIGSILKFGITNPCSIFI